MKKMLMIIVILCISLILCGADYKELDDICENEHGFSFSETAENVMAGGRGLDIKTLFESIKEEFAGEIINAFSSIISVLGTVFIFSLVSSMQHGFGNCRTGEICFFVVYSVVCASLLQNFSKTSELAVNLIDNLVLFSNAAVPVIGTSVIASGNFGVYSAMHPALIMTASLSANIIKSIGVPALMLSLSLGVIGNVSGGFSLSNISKTIRNAALWMITGLLTLFSAAVAVCGMSAPSVNGVVMRGVKFVARGAIPVLGGLLSDSAEAVMMGGVMLKNVLGTAGVCAVIVMMLYPLLKMGAVILVYKITAAFITPFCDRRISSVMEEVSGTLSCLIGFAAAEGVTVIVSMTSLINASNVGVMLR